MTGFDGILLGVIATSIFFAAIRGGLKEMATLVALAVAAVVGLFGGPALAGALGGSIFVLAGATLGLAAVAFIGAYWGAATLIGRIDLSKNQEIVDRVGGGVFGLVRAVALIGLGFLGYAYYLDEDKRPATVNEAMLLPLAKGSASFIEGFAPARKPTAKDFVPIREEAGDPNANGAAYDRSARNGLEELVTTVATDVSTDEAPTTIEEDPLAHILQSSQGDQAAERDE